jgi:predicted signal transduction protein with EAL and GGDEF domain
MSFALYMIGYVIMIAGLAVAASYLHIAAHWIVAGALVLIGLGIAGGVAKTRQKDPS